MVLVWIPVFSNRWPTPLLIITLPLTFSYVTNVLQLFADTNTVKLSTLLKTPACNNFLYWFKKDFLIKSCQVVVLRFKLLLDFPQLLYSYCCSPVLGSPLRRQCKCCFRRENFKDGNCPSPGLFAATDLVYGALINFLRKTNRKYLAFEPRTGKG
jgi:hypothetical protein